MTAVLVGGEAIDRFKSEYQGYHSLSKERRRDQLRALTSLCTHAEVESPTEVTSDHYRKWLQWLLDEDDKSPTTVEKYGMLVRAFFGWGFDVKIVSAETLMEIKRVQFPAKPKARPKPYSSKEIRRIWPALDARYPKDERFLKRWRKGTSRYKRVEYYAQHLQLRTVIRLALDCGIRREEIYNLSIDDMHYDNEYIVVEEGKGEKPREVPHTKASRAAVRDWIEFRTELNPPHDDPWLSLTRIGPEGVWLRPMHFRRFGAYLQDLDGDWKLHRLRHTCATMWLRSGMDLETVQKLLGHSHISQTLGYAELVREDVHRSVAKNEEAFEALVA